MRKVAIFVVGLMLVSLLMPAVAMAGTSNEAILELRAVFTGTSDNITLKVFITVNDAATAQEDLKYKLIIDNTVVKSNLTYNAFTDEDGYKVDWDSDVYTGDYHTITVEFVNPEEDVATSNLADNALSLGISTPGSSIGALLNAYGQLEYIISKTTRQNFNGAFSFIANYPAYLWIFILIVIIGIAWYVHRHKKMGRGPYIPPKYRGYIRLR